MTRVVRWSNQARRDLLDIWAWRGRENAELGDEVVDRIRDKCKKLARFPHLGPPFPRMAPDARKLSVDGYLAVYRLDPEFVTIVRGSIRGACSKLL